MSTKLKTLKKILINDYAGHPFILTLSKELANKGYQIIHTYSSSSGGPKANFNKINSDGIGLSIIDIDLGHVLKNNFKSRFFMERKFGIEMVKVLSRVKPDLIISANTPLLAQIYIVKWANNEKTPFIYWVQDLLSTAAKLIIRKKNFIIGLLVGRIFKRLEIKCLSISNHVICITSDFKDILIRWNIHENKISVIPNWAPLEDLPQKSKDKGFLRNFGLQDHFIVMYSGTMGMKQNPQVIVEAAEKLASKGDIAFVIVSEGLGADFLKKIIISKQLKNIIILPFQPFERIPNILGSADILLTLLESDASVYSVPSKVWSGYCSGKPSILIVPANNLAARITKQINAGIVLDINGSIKLNEAILKLKDNSKLRKVMGKNARRYAETEFDISKVSKSFENIFQRVVSEA